MIIIPSHIYIYIYIYISRDRIYSSKNVNDSCRNVLHITHVTRIPADVHVEAAAVAVAHLGAVSVLPAGIEAAFIISGPSAKQAVEIGRLIHRREFQDRGDTGAG